MVDSCIIRGDDNKYIIEKFNYFIDYINKNLNKLKWSSFKIYGKDYYMPPPFKEHNYKSITVVITNWERQIYIPYILNQIIKQDYPQNLVEIIIIDQNSYNKENLQNICKEFAKNNSNFKIRYIQHNLDPTGSVRIRRNTGIRFASNEIVIINESDTIFLNNNFFKIVSWIHSQNDKLLLIPMSLGVTDLNKYVKNEEYYITTPINEWLDNILINCYTWNFIERLDHDFCNSFNRNNVSKFNGYNECWTGWGGAEGDFANKCFKNDFKPVYSTDLIAIQLYNFPEKPRRQFAKPGNFIHREISSWGLIENQQEIDLYR